MTNPIFYMEENINGLILGESRSEYICEVQTEKKQVAKRTKM
jgi:hypothetical protein